MGSSSSGPGLLVTVEHGSRGHPHQPQSRLDYTTPYGPDFIRSCHAANYSHDHRADIRGVHGPVWTSSWVYNIMQNAIVGGGGVGVMAVGEKIKKVGAREK